MVSYTVYDLGVFVSRPNTHITFLSVVKTMTVAFSQRRVDMTAIVTQAMHATCTNHVRSYYKSILLQKMDRIMEMLMVLV